MTVYQDSSSQALVLPGLRRPNKTIGPFPFDDIDIRTIQRHTLVHALSTAPKIWDNGGVKVARIARGVVVKYGHDVNICEADNMRYVSQHTTIRLPSLLDSWVEVECGDNIEGGETICYIVMSYIDGILVDEVWSELSNTIRCGIQKQLHDFIRQLRHLKADRPGPIGGGVSQGAFFTDYGAGPFASKGEMEGWFDDRLAVCQDFGIVDAGQPGFGGLFQHLVMCHMDIHLRNLILDDQGKVWLIDWAFAGMYPAYFETASILRHGRQTYFQHLLDQLEYRKDSEQTNRLFALSFALTTGALCKPSRPISARPNYDYEE
ncbi:kinase-like domain-containing protein [Aspergillus leporis]|uniref:Kinase-like domain-containing protein n=1 Tax=Aspergillus leporis TaxID=41062 RepID=A0A5N5WPX7_9EURO|nr:kinase-like domain-containing protein [Aspergillus leporis]